MRLFINKINYYILIIMNEQIQYSNEEIIKEINYKVYVKEQVN